MAKFWVEIDEAGYTGAICGYSLYICPDVFSKQGGEYLSKRGAILTFKTVEAVVADAYAELLKHSPPRPEYGKPEIPLASIGAAWSVTGGCMPQERKGQPTHWIIEPTEVVPPASPLPQEGK